LLPAMDLSLLQFLEREKVLEVLRRDKQLRIIEEDRIRRMKYELQELRRRGAKSFTRQYGERTCARCQRPLGKFWNSGSICRGCSHRICTKCRVGATDWKCTVCHPTDHVTLWLTNHCTERLSVASLPLTLQSSPNFSLKQNASTGKEQIHTNIGQIQTSRID
uniref:RabBD domain-containing protein n=1 Tax=Salarias fasciatus TaxID=181472 RepID=A0A672H9Z9_SALFA